MALIPINRYPDQIDADAAYPQGKARNITVSGDGTGTPWEKDLVNDVFGLLQSLLSDASITPSGNPDEVGASDYLTAIKAMVLGSQADFALADSVSNQLSSNAQASFMRVSAAGPSRILSGVQSSIRKLRVVANTGANAWAFAHEDVAVAAALRILCPDDVNMTMRPGDVALLAYDVTSSRWRVLGKRVKVSELVSDATFLGGNYGWTGEQTWTWFSGGRTFQIGPGDVVLSGAAFTATGASVHFQAQNAGSNPGFTFTGTLPQRVVTWLPGGDLYTARANAALSYPNLNNQPIGHPIPIPRGAAIRGLRGAFFQQSAGSSVSLRLELVRVTRNKTGSGPAGAPVVLGVLDELATFNTENVILDVGSVNYQLTDPDINLEARVTLADNAASNTQRIYWLEVTFDDPGPRNY